MIISDTKDAIVFVGVAIMFHAFVHGPPGNSHALKDIADALNRIADKIQK